MATSNPTGPTIVMGSPTSSPVGHKETTVTERSKPTGEVQRPNAGKADHHAFEDTISS